MLGKPSVDCFLVQQEGDKLVSSNGAGLIAAHQVQSTEMCWLCISETSETCTEDKQESPNASRQVSYWEPL